MNHGLNISPGSFSDGFKTNVFPHVTATGNICSKILKQTIRFYN